MAVLATTGLSIVGAPAAHAATKGVAQPITAQCVGYLENNDGSRGPQVPPGSPFPLPTTVAAVGGPTEVNAGASFDGTAGSVAVKIPPIVDTGIQGVGIDETDDGVGDGKVPVVAAAAIVQTIEVTGAASIGTPTLSGGNVIGATVTKTGPTTIKIKLPGTRATSAADFRVPPAYTDIVPGDEHEFPAKSTYSTPTLKIPVTAGAAGTTITFKMTGQGDDPNKSHFNDFSIDSFVDAFGNGLPIFVRAFCDPIGHVLGKVRVVSPPPPGAPDAVADVAQTDQGKAVNVDVLANDTPNAALAIDKDSLAVTANPDNGSVKVNADHTVTYSPAADFAGTDEFTYKLCSVPEPATSTTSTTTTTEPSEVPQAVVHAAATTEHCDHATVTVTVLAPQQVAELPETTPTTVAAAAELPKTGSSSTPLALLGVGFVVTGFAATGLVTRSRRRTA